MKILLLSPFPPRRDGLHGGSQVIGRVLDELAGSHSVAVAYLRADGEPAMEAELAARCQAVEEVARHLGAARWPRLLSAWAVGRPMWVKDWEVPEFRSRAAELARRFQPDIAQIEFHVMGQYLDTLAGIPAVLVIHEPGTATARDRWHGSRGWQRPVLRRDFTAWRRYERDLLGRVSAAVALTTKDRRELQALEPRLRVEVIPPPGPAFTDPLSPLGHPPLSILFAGNYMHPPNVDAAMRLAGEIFPLVKKRHPEAVLILAGDSTPASVQRVAGEGVVVTGRVPSITPLLDAAAVVALPLRSGGGIRVKTMEAFAAGKAVVASALAVEGMDVRDGHEFLLAESAEEFAQRISTLLSDPEERKRLAHNGRRWAVGFQQRGRTAQAYETLYSELLACHARQTRDHRHPDA